MSEVSKEALEVLKNSTVIDNVVKLPEQQLERKVYLEVKNKLELIGGKWKGGKVQGFEFATNPTELIEQVANGENRNLKKEYQFFATPDDLADELVFQAEVEPHHLILEPSAGQGAIIEALHRVFPKYDKQISCVELMDVNEFILRNKTAKKLWNVGLVRNDFLTVSFNQKFDRIIANPPFSKNQDIDHIRKMYDLLVPGGRLISIASNHWKLSDNAKETAFRNWLYDLGADVEDIEAGRFKSSGTMVGGCIIIINKAK